MNQYPRITSQHSPGMVIALYLLGALLTVKAINEAVISPYDHRGVTTQRALSLVFLLGLLALTLTQVSHRGSHSFAAEVRLLWLGVELRLGRYPDLP